MSPKNLPHPLSFAHRCCVPMKPRGPGFRNASSQAPRSPFLRGKEPRVAASALIAPKSSGQAQGFGDPRRQPGHDASYLQDGTWSPSLVMLSISSVLNGRRRDWKEDGRFCDKQPSSRGSLQGPGAGMNASDEGFNGAHVFTSTTSGRRPPREQDLHDPDEVSRTR